MLRRACETVRVPSLSADLTFRGLVHQVTDENLLRRLDSEQLTAYIGFDPTADSLHVGHLVQVLLLGRLQRAGHRVLGVAGGATGLIGDPSGRASERRLLGPDELRSNLESIRKQLEALLDSFPMPAPSGSAPGGTTASESPARVVLLDNAEWLGELRLIDFLRDVGKHFGVGEMIAKESVRSRLSRAGSGVSFTELAYMLLQAYDFLHLHDAYGCKLQLGASDQWGNITVGMELVRKLRGVQVFGLTTPLVLKADGEKFGKSATGTVWLDPAKTSPYRLYQFLVRAEDAVVGSYLRRLTFLSHEEILALDAETAAHPERRDAQRALARHVCTLVHGLAETERAERAAAALFSEAIADLDEAMLVEICSEAPATDLPRSLLEPPGASVADLLARSGLASSKTRARSILAQGGASVNNVRVSDPDALVSISDLLCDRYVVLRRGRRDYHLVRFG